MITAGGRIDLEMNGEVYKPRGVVKIMPTSVEVESGTNMNGSGYRTIKPVNAKIELTFERDRFRWDDKMMLADWNVTVVERDVKPTVTHVATAATMVGRPEIDTATGELTGITLETDAYRAV